MDDDDIKLLEEVEAFVDVVDNIQLLREWHREVCNMLLYSRLFSLDTDIQRVDNARKRVYTRLYLLGVEEAQNLEDKRYGR